MNLETLDRPIADLASELMVADLASLSAGIAAEEAVIKRRKETLHAINTRRFLTDATTQLATERKDTGTANLVQNGVTVKVEIGKKVKWDQPKLMAALNNFPPDEAKHYAKVTLEVSETKFKAAPPAIQAALSDARTVETETPKFTFKFSEAEAA